MKKIIVLIMLVLTFVTCSVCSAASAEVMSLHRKYSNSIGFWNGFSEAILEIVQSNDVTRMEKVRNNVNTKVQVQRDLMENITLLTRAAQEPGTGVPNSIMTAFRSTWQCKYRCANTYMDKIVFCEGPIKPWSQQQINELSNCLRASREADKVYFDEMIKAGIPR